MLSCRWAIIHTEVCHQRNGYLNCNSIVLMKNCVVSSINCKWSLNENLLLKICWERDCMLLEININHCESYVCEIQYTYTYMYYSIWCCSRSTESKTSDSTVSRILKLHIFKLKLTFLFPSEFYSEVLEWGREEVADLWL